jgi:hypothetical protein
MPLISFKDYLVKETLDESVEIRSVRSSFRNLDSALVVDLQFRRLIKSNIAEKIVIIFLNYINNKIFGKRSKHSLRVFPVLKRVGSSIKSISLVIEDPSKLNSRNYRQSIEDFENLLISEWDKADRLTRNPSKPSKHNQWLKASDSPDKAIMDLWSKIRNQNNDVLWSLVQI